LSILAQIVYNRLHPCDWADDWVFYDSRFNLLRASDEAFLRFLCETIHPVVCLDPVEALKIGAEDMIKTPYQSKKEEELVRIKV